MLGPQPPPQIVLPLPEPGVAALITAINAHRAFDSRQAEAMVDYLHLASLAQSGPWPLPVNFAIQPLPGREPALWVYP